ncbi:MAG: NFACT family protein [Bacteroidota bacterium]|nr:NFACT family protein [Bacteroidota bacterium]
MIVHYFTLRAFIQELQPFLQNTLIIESFTQTKDELIVTLNKIHDEKTCKSLCVSVKTRFNYIVLRDQSKRATKNTVDLFNNIAGSTLQQISIHPTDRTIIIELDSSKRLFIQLYNTESSNIILVDEHNTILKSFKRNKELKGKLFSIQSRDLDQNILTDLQHFLSKITNTAEVSILTGIKKLFPILGSVYVREILHRAKILEPTLIKNLHLDELTIVHRELQRLWKEAFQPSPRIYTLSEKEKILSIIPLHHLEDNQVETFSSVNNAIRVYLAQTFKEQSISDEKVELSNKLQHELHRAQRAFEETSGAKLTDPSECDHIGNVLLASLQHLKKGMKHISLENIGGDSDYIEIDLNPELTPVQNAERYFEKARRARTAEKETQKRIIDLHRKIDTVKKLLDSLQVCQSKVEVKEYKKVYEKELRAFKMIGNRFEDELPPFRIFQVAGGYEVWVGKSSANNDLLTMKYAKPNDLWFHARGSSGSHTVLKVKSGVKDIPKETIYQAASIAAYYSKMRKANNVPVAYTERKYVRKPKGAPAGTVTLEREEVIFVKPYLPQPVEKI